MSEALERALQAVLVDCLGVATGENVVILSDPGKRKIADDLVTRARLLGAETVLVEMSERANNGSEPPPAAAAAMRECDVLIAPTSKSASHTQARLDACERGARAATMPGITEEMLLRTMGADYAGIKQRSETVAAALTDAAEAHITTEAGTDLTLDLTGRTGIPDGGDLRAPGAFGNLPAGEGFIAPVEGVARGRIVFDGSIWPIGILEEPLTIEIEDGYARAMSGPAADAFRAIIEPYGEDAFAIAELGVGTNEAALLTGNVLEDEKILGTIHIAFGDNHTIGGKTRVPSHQDGIVLKPTLTLDGKALLTQGRMLV